MEKSIFETGAIMLYLSNKNNKFCSQKYYWEIMQWFFYPNFPGRSFFRTGSPISLLS